MHSERIRQLEQDMIPVKASMEQQGLNVNLSLLEELITSTAREKEDIAQNLRRDLGVKGKVNFNSSRDVSEIILPLLGVKAQRTRTGRYTTSRDVLRGINHPITQQISKYRDLEKQHSSLKSIHKATDKARGKIFCKYTDDCPTGRLYSKDYNFQSFSKISRSIIYPDDGCVFLLVDYDSFELKILSALSHDKYFKYCWARGLDLHRKVVADMKNIPYDDVTPAQRKLGKVLNFGISYLQEPAGLARNLHCPVYEAQKLMDDYKKQIPDIEQFKLEVIKQAHETGYSETLWGRRRYLAYINSSNNTERKKAERQAVNTRIQGLASDIVKQSLVSLHQAGFIINTMLHDAVLLTVPEAEAEETMKRVRDIMEIEINDMRFTVSCKVGTTWKDCYEE
jgi:DNA polymerase-1